MDVPAWQTRELEEEWVEPERSPPFPSDALPTESLPLPTNDSIKVKRVSLRALGHAAARSLPAPRSPSGASPRIVSGHGEGRVLSEKYDNGQGGHLPSPPTSQSSNEAHEKEPAAGTFVVKDGVDDDRGRQLARNAFGKAKTTDMFGPTALEKMFQPPSPPPQPQVIEPTSNPNPDPVLHDDTPTPAPRKPSHPYAPANPSRLSKSVTPSTVSGSTSFSLPSPEDMYPSNIDENGPDVSYTVEGGEGETSQSARRHHLLSGEVETDLSPLLRGGNYPFRFNAPLRSASRPNREEDYDKLFDPSLSPFGSGEPSHSTLHRVPHTKHGMSSIEATSGLRLFRSTYDTYTREHLSALVDSIAIEPSPSPTGDPNASGAREWSPEGTPSYFGSGSRSGSKSGSRLSDENDMRSSKRMRMSPCSPGRQVCGMRDWGAQGRAMMDKIRGRDAESTTSASLTRTSDEVADEEGGAEDEPTIDYADIPPSPPSETRQSQPARPTHRSYPSTTSSGYLRAAEDLMAKIKARVVSESGSNVEQSPGTIDPQRLLSASSSEWEMAALAVHGRKIKDKMVGSSPRRTLRRLSTSEEARRAAEASSEDDTPAGSSDKVRLDERRPTSAAAKDLDGSDNPGRKFDQDDLNRFVSATTVATSTTISTSFVKHRGPRAGGAGVLRMIKPDDLMGVVPDRVGKMKFDKENMRWIREGLGRVDEAGESRASRSRSEESEDVFAGMDSWGREIGVPVPVSQPTIHEVETDGDSTSTDKESVQQADRTHAIDNGSEISSDDEEARDEAHSVQDSSPQKVSPPTRPVPHHVESAPAVMTPTQETKGATRPIRSALRNANLNSDTPAFMKKHAGWHESVTPAAGSSGSARRSVSFSDGKKSGKIRELHPDETEETSASDVPWLKKSEGQSWLPSARTKRIEGLLQDMDEMSLEDATPSKPPKSVVIASEDVIEDESGSEAESGVQDQTVRPIDARSFRARADANATFLTECSFGVAHDRLVQLITDVYGSEPYWEHLKVLDLRGKGADSVARLKEFLPDLIEVNLDDNKISYLSGIPIGVRSLRVAGNRLSSLTSVDHLGNLRVLDISRNQLDSVMQLSCLRHLRELKADDNSITDLDGVLDIDALVKFSAANNKIRKVDLSHAKWERLEELNLANNKIDQISNLQTLSAIGSLILDGNDITNLHPSQPMTTLRTLRASDNDLTSLDLSRFPRLRTLYADRNQLRELDRSQGGTSRIQNLSLRNQRIAGLKLGMKELERVKRLYLSGNPLTDHFFPSTPLKSLVYLEVAACNFLTWPKDLYRRMPNLTILNYNYNYVENMDGLKGMKNLRKVTVVGARLGASGAKGVARGLRDLSNLEEIDLRMNPSTLGYYLPLILPTPLTSSTTLPDHSPPPKQAPLPSVTLATIRPLGIVQADPTPAHIWAKLDGQFRRSLPDEWYSKRLIYRGLIMLNCPRLRVLDGITIEEGEKNKAERLLQITSGEGERSCQS